MIPLMEDRELLHIIRSTYPSIQLNEEMDFFPSNKYVSEIAKKLEQDKTEIKIFPTDGHSIEIEIKPTDKIYEDKILIDLTNRGPFAFYVYFEHNMGEPMTPTKFTRNRINIEEQQIIDILTEYNIVILDYFKLWKPIPGRRGQFGEPTSTLFDELFGV